MLQSNNSKTSMVLKQKWTHWSMEWNRGSRSKHTHTATYSHQIFDNGVKNLAWRRNNPCKKWWGKLVSPRRRKLDLHLSSRPNICSKCFKDFNIRFETTREKTLRNIVIGKDEKAPAAQKTAARSSKWNDMKSRSCCTLRKQLGPAKPTEWRQLLASYTSEEDPWHSDLKV